MNQNKRILLTIYLEEGSNTHIRENNFIKQKVRIQTISAKVVDYFQSKESRPIKKCSEHFNWYKMTPHQRLMWNLSQNAEGKKFEFSFF